MTKKYSKPAQERDIVRIEEFVGLSHATRANSVIPRAAFSTQDGGLLLLASRPMLKRWAALCDEGRVGRSQKPPVTEATTALNAQARLLSGAISLQRTLS